MLEAEEVDQGGVVVAVVAVAAGFHFAVDHLREGKVASLGGHVEEDVEGDVCCADAGLELHLTPELEGGVNFDVGYAADVLSGEDDGAVPFGCCERDPGVFHVGDDGEVAQHAG